MKKKHQQLLSHLESPHRAILLATSERESGAWLDALPSANLETLLDKHVLQIAVSLRIGSEICQPHFSVCGTLVDRLGHHGLSCSKSYGRFSRHSAINNILKRAFVSADIPSILEPCGLFRSDGKRPDGITMIPWRKNRSLVWDVTCVDTVAATHLKNSCLQPETDAATAERMKNSKYSEIKESYEFLPFAEETFGTWGSHAKLLINELGNIIKNKSGVPQAIKYLQLHISIAIQRGNVASVLGTVGKVNGLESLFYMY